MVRASVSILCLVAIVMMLACGRGERSQPTSRAMLRWGGAPEQLGEMLRELDGAADLPPRHLFTVRHQSGHEVMGVGAMCEGTRLLFVFESRGLAKIVLSPGDWPGGRGGATQSEEGFVERAMSAESLTLDEVRDLCRRHGRAEALAAEYKEPVPVLSLFPDRGAHDKTRYVELMERFNGARARLGDSMDTVAGVLGPPRTTESRDGTILAVYGAAEDLGWYAAPRVHLVFRDGKAERVTTDYLGPR